MTDHALPQRRRGAGPRGRVPRRQGWYLPYLIILPAVVFELAMHEDSHSALVAWLESTAPR